ncbi:ATP-binding protein [Cohnella kolymensis]|uniref:ATP-binding protein n=1 Tax=Cohnella kolymensis TaxID=1590652 RepID=UPI000AB39F2D|nr:ATP-binding protein [Cohnella kolymensis]
MFRHFSLQNRILILVTIVTVSMMSVIVWFDSYSLQKSVEETYVSQLNGMTTAINGRYEESHETKDVQQIFDYIQFKNKDVLQLTLYGEDKILASTNRVRIGLPTPPGLIPQVAANEMLVDHLHRGEDNIPVDRLTAPLKEDGITIGAIELLLNTSESTALIKNRTLLIIVVGISITLLLLFALSGIIRRMLIKPLMKLREAALTVKHGVAYREISLDYSKEVNEVAAAFNDMVRNLEGRYEELRLAMKTIRKTQRQLVESEKMVALGNLVAGVSHEINTPIGIGVTAASYIDEKSKEFTALFQQNTMKRSDLEEYLKTVKDTTGMIQSNLLRASELIRSFKQVAVDRSLETKRNFKIKEYVQEVLVSLQPNLKKTKHHVTVNGEADIEIVSDPGAVSQIVTNFIMNSIIHGYEPEDEGSLAIDIAKHGKQLTMQYSDDGKGMPPEVVEQIFDPFFTTNRGGGGTGLGMHIVYISSPSHWAARSDASAKSVPARRLSFKFQLMRDDIIMLNDHQEDLLTFADEELSDIQKAAPEEEKWKIVIVDDEHEVHHVTKMVLNDFEFDGKRLEFLSAYTEAEALRLIADNPDTAIILLDVVMDEDDSGLKIVKYIRQTLKYQSVRIILRTGQPGQAPEKLVITNYDINDYKEKTRADQPEAFYNDHGRS